MSNKSKTSVYSNKTYVKKKWNKGEKSMDQPCNYTKDCKVKNITKIQQNNKEYYKVKNINKSQSSKIQQNNKEHYSSSSSISTSTSCNNNDCTSLTCNDKTKTCTKEEWSGKGSHVKKSCNYKKDCSGNSSDEKSTYSWVSFIIDIFIIIFIIGAIAFGIIVWNNSLE